MEVSKKDWKLYREKMPQWQEAYMERLAKEYIELLSQDKSSAERFWTLEKRIKEDKKKPGVIVEMSRSHMLWDIIGLISDEAITLDDLNDFSEEFKEEVAFVLERSKRIYTYIEDDE